MTEVPLDLRPQSYGSPQQPQNGSLKTQNGFATARKPSRMSLTSSRENYKFLPFLCRYLNRKKIVMRILGLFALMAFLSAFFNANSACPVCYLSVEETIASTPSTTSASPVLQHLTYFHEETSTKTEPHEGSNFGGYPSIKQRNESFDIKESMTVHCEFVKGCRPGYKTGFDIDVSDLVELE
ncbi:hypothetical protein HanOQP8_Chr01g0031701 [Helianthus annuus]|nr:hypothetical protein HanIR_Chr01g0041971 [Helianthus annuus]KAJ0793650.1 hypothetical protein HanOQP8_Chr01g0031701 [Helianthus annuus]